MATPTPIGNEIKRAGHHWLKDDIGNLMVLQWSPSAQQWCNSGWVATNRFIDASHLTYIAPCPEPE